MNKLVILDFETTGLSPAYARVIEVGAILIEDTKIVDKLSQLMYPGCSMPSFITDITGITNEMVKGKPSPEKFMPKLKEFIGNRPILAHNASFDQKFLISEMENVGKKVDNRFLCTLKLSRRLITNAPDYKLTTLVSHLKIKPPGIQQAHRALYDVMSTFQLWLHMKKYVMDLINTTPDFDFFVKLERQPKSKISHLLDKYAIV
jgi:DNA polymerase-3 subunit epsilon